MDCTALKELEADQGLLGDRDTRSISHLLYLWPLTR